MWNIMVINCSKLVLLPHLFILIYSFHTISKHVNPTKHFTMQQSHIMRHFKHVCSYCVEGEVYAIQSRTNFWLRESFVDYIFEFRTSIILFN